MRRYELIFGRLAVFVAALILGMLLPARIALAQG